MNNFSDKLMNVLIFNPAQLIYIECIKTVYQNCWHKSFLECETVCRGGRSLLIKGCNLKANFHRS